jgi:cell division protease FtsH
MHRMSKALLDRESLDATELKLLIEGKDLPPLELPPSGPGGDVQHVLKPDAGRAPGFAGEQPSPA